MKIIDPSIKLKDKEKDFFVETIWMLDELVQKIDSSEFELTFEDLREKARNALEALRVLDRVLLPDEEDED